MEITFLVVQTLNFRVASGQVTYANVQRIRVAISCAVSSKVVQLLNQKAKSLCICLKNSIQWLDLAAINFHECHLWLKSRLTRMSCKLARSQPEGH